MIYAGFWKRAIAFLIDGIIISIPIAAFSFLVGGAQFYALLTSSDIVSLLEKWVVLIGIIFTFNIIVIWLYHAFMESSVHQATFGKMALGIKVVDAHGKRISFARATGRTFGKFISHLTLYFGDYMAGFTKHRQALHDFMASTYVVNKNYQEGQELTALPFNKGGLIASILFGMGPIILYILSVLLVMSMAVSDMKEDPDIQQLWNALTTENENKQLSKELNDLQRDFALTSAQVKMANFHINNITLKESLEVEGIVYSQIPEGYKATFKDPHGNEYEVLQRTNEVRICCLKGPEGKCTDDETLCPPCK